MQAVLGVRTRLRSLARRLHDRAGGNPFFLEQMCAALLEQQAVTMRDGEALVRWRRECAVAARYRSGSDTRAARQPGLACARDPAGGLGHRIGSSITRSSQRWCRRMWISGPAIGALETAGLIQQTAPAPAIGYRFTHALTQEVCYDSLVGHQRKMLHGAIGRALALHSRGPHGRKCCDARAPLRARGGLAGRDPLRPTRRGARDRAQPVRRCAGDARSGPRMGRPPADGRSERPQGRPAAPAGASVRDAGPSGASTGRSSTL